MFTHTRVTGIDVRVGASAVSRPSGATSRLRSSSTPAGCSPPRSDAWPGSGAGHPVLAPVPRHAAVPRARSVDEHLPTLRDPDLLIYFREEGAGLVMGGYERDSTPWSLDEKLVDRIPADFNGRLLEEDWRRFEEIAENSRRRVPVMERDHGHEADQRPGGVHARQRVLPR